jgi:leader peptidase (prepilin peptidase) / N-methyltransferase
VEALILIFIFILGTIIGSFLNVVILRFGKKSVAKGRSFCPKCNKTLEWYELVPILSYIFLLGKCHKCKKKISIQYPLVELSTGILFVLNYKAWIPVFTGMTNDSINGTVGVVIPAQTGIQALIMFVALCILVVIFVYDLYHKIIPDTFSFSFGILSLIYMFLNFKGGNLSREVLTKWDLLAPIIFFTPFYLLWRLSDGKWIGLGDGKLAFGFGGFLGLIYGTSALVLSFWIGAIFAVGLMLIYRLSNSKNNITMKSEIPFGPFMIIAFLIVYFWGIDVTGISGLLNVL